MRGPNHCKEQRAEIGGSSELVWPSSLIDTGGEVVSEKKLVCWEFSLISFAYWERRCLVLQLGRVNQNSFSHIQRNHFEFYIAPDHPPTPVGDMASEFENVQLLHCEFCHRLPSHLQLTYCLCPATLSHSATAGQLNTSPSDGPLACSFTSLQISSRSQTCLPAATNVSSLSGKIDENCKKRVCGPL